MMTKQNEPPLLVWLINRLACMPFAEVVHRARHACTSWLVKRSIVQVPAAVLVQFMQMDAPVFSLPADIDVAPYIREADAILAGDVSLFATGETHVGDPPAWNLNAQSSHGADHRTNASDSKSGRAPESDIKYIWELNRHLQWVRLAQAYVLSADERYRLGLAGQIRSWLEQCPPLTGPNWSSAMELAIRLMNWSVVWQMLGGGDGALFKDADGEQLRTRWLASIYAHGQFISKNLSRHSSANNHLIGELAGLYVAARTWPFEGRSYAWAAQAKAGLEREAGIQHFPDGGNREQAFAYQAYTCECLTIAGIYDQHSEAPFSDAYWRVLRRAYRFLRSMKDVGGNFPLVGDADDGAVLRLAPRDGGVRAATIVSLGDAIFGEPVAARPDDTVRWLLGEQKNWQRARDSEPSTDWQFPASGYFLFGARFGERDEVKGMVDCGPLGYLGIAAHGHADALAIWLSIAGEECLVDPGTFSYGGAYHWRSYFRGTSAHNTVRVDGLDQSVSGGRFMWTRKATTRVDKVPLSPAPFEFVGSHDGYQRLGDAVRHVRSVIYDDALMQLIVRDDIVGKTNHEIEQFWHFAPNVQVRLGDGKIVASGKRFQLEMQFSPNDLDDLDLQLIRGQEDPPLGWYSRSYGAKEPTTVLRARTSSRAATIEARFAISVFDHA